MLAYKSAFRWLVALLSFICLCWSWSPAFAQGAASTSRADLDQLVQSAQNIVRGQVISAIVEPHPQFPNLQTILITISVAKVLKGPAGTTLTYRQFLWDARGATGLGAYKSAGESIFFLNPVSQYGLSSPVGLEQGRFRVLHDAKGNRYVLNGRGNLGLFTQLNEKASSRGITFSKPVREMLSQQPGKASLEPFEEAVQTLAGTSK